MSSPVLLEALKKEHENLVAVKKAILTKMSLETNHEYHKYDDLMEKMSKRLDQVKNEINLVEEKIIKASEPAHAN